jgi:hypothetical protein
MILGIDGLETKVWGVRDDTKINTDVDESDSEGAENESDDNEADDSEDEESDDNEGDVSGEDEEYSDEDSREPSPPRSRSPTPISEPSSPPTYQTYAERQQALHLAERLLARTLAAADAEGSSMAAEMGTSPSLASLSSS